MPAPRIFGLWLMALVPLLIAVDNAPVQRTQEARVVETARQMVGRGAHAWLIPSINGEIRLRKPPLAYWMAAASFKLFGVSEGTARLPNILLCWLLIGATYSIAARLFDQLTGLFAAAALLSSYMFFRYSRLAETDMPAAFFATVATELFWRALDTESMGLFHAAAVATGLSFFAKQGPGFFPLIFFVTMALLRKKPRAIGKFFISGAPLTLLVVAGWWYAYAIADQGMAQFRRELTEVTEGTDHPATFLVYIPWILSTTAPWSLLVAGAIVVAAQRCRQDPVLLGLLVWSAADLVPLFFLGNKQEHYLIPLLAPLMILAAWLIRRAVTSEEDVKLKHTVATLMGLTIIASILAPLAIPIAARHVNGIIRASDIGLAVMISAASVFSFLTLKRRGLVAAAVSFAVVWAFALAIVVDIWAPTITPGNVRVSAAKIQQRFGDGPFISFGQYNSLPLCFAMRREIPHIAETSPDELVAQANKVSGLIVICEMDNAGKPPELPAGFSQINESIGAAGQLFRFYQLQASHSE